MPNLLDIRRRIKSVKNTQQITKAMKMVSAAKLKRAQDRVVTARPFANKMMEVDVSLSGTEVSLSTPRVLFDQRYTFETSTIANYDIGLDGQRFLMVKDEFGAGRLNIILNWFEELRRLAPVQ